VVGLDDSAGARAALRWAAEEARLHGRPLRIVHAWYSREPGPREHRTETVPTALRPAARLLDAAARQVRASYPDLDVDTVLLTEAPADALVRLSADAGLLVVGRRGSQRRVSVVLGSVGGYAVAHALVPVVVVPGPGGTADAITAAGTGVPVVVGVTRGAPGPVLFAFAEAQARGAPLLAVRSWELSSPYVVSVGEDCAAMDADERAELGTLLADARRAYPSVPVGLRVTSLKPESALVDASAEAALLVLGRHRRHGRHGLPLGHVVHRVLHRADCPVAVVPG
jgi:nucleotide-binding universal stress UspA family protein